MRAFVTGQVGVDKGPFLERVAAESRAKGFDITVCHVGKMMYREAPDVPAGKILNLPMPRLNALRRAVFKEILTSAQTHEHVLVNTHATFRWRHGLFAAFDFDQLKAFDADLYLTLVDNVEHVYQRLAREHDMDHSLKDVMVWREEEMLATEIVANIIRGHGHYFVLGRGPREPRTQTAFRLMFEPWRKKAYLSFPMSHVMDLPATLAEIDAFKQAMNQHLICFDPGDIDEVTLHTRSLAALAEGKTSIDVAGRLGQISLKTADIAATSGDLLGQTYARDFKMIDQSDMIISLVPELPGGRPALSSGVERELHHAYETGKETFVIWPGAATPSPFITETATQVFRSSADAMRYFEKRGYFGSQDARVGNV